MNKTVYISGSITDPATGQPRDGWQKDFLEAEAKLRAMGFYVINPVDIAREADMLHAVYIVGDIYKARFSRGVGMEMNLAELLDIPIYVDCVGGKRVTWVPNSFVPVSESADITELLKED